MSEKDGNFVNAGEEFAENSRAESAAKLGPNSTILEGQVKAVPDMEDGEHPVDSATGEASEKDVPPDPNAKKPEETPSPSHPPESPSPSPTPPRTPERSDRKPLVSSVIVSASEFESKKKSFFNPDIDKGFWDTLDQKLKEALSGNTSDEIAQNMAFASIGFIFEAISNWAVHHRKEAKRVKREYEEKIKAFDDVLKNTLIEKYGMVAEYAIKHGINITTKEGVEKLEKLMNNKEFLGLTAGALSTSLGREVSLEETKKMLQGTRKALSKGNIALDSQEVADALGTQAAQDNAAYWDKRAKDQKLKFQNIAQYRTALHEAENSSDSAGKSRAQLREEVLQR